MCDVLAAVQLVQSLVYLLSEPEVVVRVAFDQLPDIFIPAALIACRSLIDSRSHLPAELYFRFPSSPFSIARVAAHQGNQSGCLQSGRFEIGQTEVIACEQYWHSGDFCDCICEAVSHVQSRGVAALAVAEECVLERRNVVATERHDQGLYFGEELIHQSTGVAAKFHCQNKLRFRHRGCSDNNHTRRSHFEKQVFIARFLAYNGNDGAGIESYTVSPVSP